MTHGQAFDLDHHAGVGEPWQRNSRDRRPGTGHGPQAAGQMPQQIVFLDAAVADIEGRQLHEVRHIRAAAVEHSADIVHDSLRLSFQIPLAAKLVPLVQIDLAGDEDHLVADEAVAVVGDAGSQAPMAERADVSARQHRCPPCGAPRVKRG
jgi:hypothetical protein